MLEVLDRKLEKNEAVVCVIGTGYVGLPLCVEFARSGLRVIGFDLNTEKVKDLNLGNDVTGELENGYLKESVKEHGLVFTSDVVAMKDADFIIVCVPTPINEKNEPDISHIERAGEIIGKNLKKGCVVVLESTVYPGVTEDVLKSTIENEAGMVCGRDFSIGYSPERVNPGDREHNLKSVVKVVSGFDQKTGEVLKSLYGRIVDAGVFVAKDIKTAEAAKVIENIQRDLNIALVNELSMIFRKMGIDTNEVLEAAGTKWNFHKYSPGLVGGHCIPVDPYYLVHKSRQLGYEPKVILAGREINNSMPGYVAKTVIEALKGSGRKEKSKALLIGLTFKKNVKDTRNAPVKGIIKELEAQCIKIVAYDPLLSEDVIKREFGIESVKDLNGVSGIDCIITVTDHDIFRESVTPEKLKAVSSPGAVVFDTRRMIDPEKAKGCGFNYIF
jgi:UDP-N-acetyl-D-galactosamine dehydrogenase